jgi:hypothetical protein
MVAGIRSAPPGLRGSGTGFHQGVGTVYPATPDPTETDACMDDIDNALERIIAIAGDRFDSHDIIRTFAHDNQRRYIELLQGTHGDKPFQTLHSALGRRIKTLCERHGFAGEASNSLDVFNQNSSCIAWSRG